MTMHTAVLLLTVRCSVDIAQSLLYSPCPTLQQSTGTRTSGRSTILTDMSKTIS